MYLERLLGGPELFEGQFPQFSPEQNCLDVGGNYARARFAWAKALCAAFFLKCDFVRRVFRGAGDRDGYLCSERQRY